MRGEEEKLIEKAEMTILCFVFFLEYIVELISCAFIGKGRYKGLKICLWDDQFRNVHSYISLITRLELQYRANLG